MQMLITVPEPQVLLQKNYAGCYIISYNRNTKKALEELKTINGMNYHKFMQILRMAMINISHVNEELLVAQQKKKWTDTLYVELLRKKVNCFCGFESFGEARNKVFEAYFTAMFFKLGEILIDPAGLSRIAGAYFYCDDYIKERSNIAYNELTGLIFDIALKHYDKRFNNSDNQLVG